ncbi:MAG: hypothetical protein JWN44_6017 [Myxococcales bacterium]|nr:hypothetical protein [Myxococcales bacterium]
MRAFLALGLAVCGCAHGAADIENQPLFAAGWSGPPPRVAVQLTGNRAAPADQQRCVDTVTRAGAIVDGGAAVQALVIVDGTGNRLQITSTRRGLVRDEPRPAWSVERLCNDALYAMVGAIRRDTPQAETAVPGATTTYRTHVPPPSGPYAAPQPGGSPDDGPPPMPYTSGAPYRGPAQP